MSDDRAQVAQARERIRTVLGDVPPRWFLVDVDRQLLLEIADDVVCTRWVVSTASAGVNARQDSGGTPPGVHRVADRIGDGQPPGTVFESREPTGELWHPDGPADSRDLILSRILTLEGLEEGVNRGPEIDSAQRFIYLHGTNHEGSLGAPTSHGCIRLSHQDVLAVFEAAVVGDPVVIV